MIQAPNYALWLATGNNPDLSSEMTRRTISIRMDAKQERPEERTDFQHPDLLGWVQANRLRIVAEHPGQATVVCLELSLSPAPSWAALGWLETSVRSYAKYVDVAARASGGDDDEGAVMRRERMAIDEVAALIDEMMEEEIGEVCPRCGQEVRPENDPNPPGG